MKTFDDVSELLDNGFYNTKVQYPKDKRHSNNFIQDESKSVIWNREFVKNHNKVIIDQIQNYHKDQNRLYNLFREDLIEAIIDYTGISKFAADIIFSYAYEEGHAYGYRDVMIKAEELSELVETVIRLKDTV